VRRLGRGWWRGTAAGPGFVAAFLPSGKHEEYSKNVKGVCAHIVSGPVRICTLPEAEEGVGFCLPAPGGALDHQLFRWTDLAVLQKMGGSLSTGIEGTSLQGLFRKAGV